MKKGLTIKQKRLIFILSGVLVILLTFFLIFQKNMKKVSDLETKNVELSGQVDLLSNLQIQINEMQTTTKERQQKIEKYASEYPCKMTQQKVISSLYHMWKDTGMELRSIKPGEERIFFKEGKLIDLSTEGESSGEAQDTEISEVEKNPETKVPFHLMIGKVTAYEIEVSGTRKQILKAFDWISKNPEHISLSEIGLSFDKSTGKLTGNIKVLFYSLNGNGVPYEEPDISGITIGNKDVFGTFKK